MITINKCRIIMVMRAHSRVELNLASMFLTMLFQNSCYYMLELAVRIVGYCELSHNVYQFIQLSFSVELLSRMWHDCNLQDVLQDYLNVSFRLLCSCVQQMTVMCCTFLMGRDPKLYKDPLTFKPERWLRSDSNDAINGFAWLPFGFGPRSCIGKKLVIQ